MVDSNNMPNDKQSSPDNDPHNYWRESYLERPYYQEAKTATPDLDYDRDFSGAYEVGTRARSEYDRNTRFEDVEDNLKTSWEKVKAESRLKWDQAKHAVKDAWDRV